MVGGSEEYIGGFIGGWSSGTKDFREQAIVESILV